LVHHQDKQQLQQPPPVADHRAGAAKQQGDNRVPAQKLLQQMQSLGRLESYPVVQPFVKQQQAAVVGGGQHRSWSRGRSAGALQLIASTAKVSGLA
jgi:hypothetical protein